MQKITAQGREYLTSIAEKNGYPDPQKFIATVCGALPKNKPIDQGLIITTATQVVMDDVNRGQPYRKWRE